MAQPTSQTVPQRPETVGVSAVLIEATPGRSDRIFSPVSDSVMVVAESDDGTRSECGLFREGGSVLHVCADFSGGFAAVADAGPGNMVVADLADARILFPADPAGQVTMSVAELANSGILFLFNLAGPVTLGVADLADAGILFPADPARTVTADVAFLADAEEVTVGVIDLAILQDI